MFTGIRIRIIMFNIAIPNYFPVLVSLEKNNTKNKVNKKHTQPIRLNSDKQCRLLRDRSIFEREANAFYSPSLHSIAILKGEFVDFYL